MKQICKRLSVIFLALTIISGSVLTTGIVVNADTYKEIYKEDFNSYEKALNLISFGNASSINGEVAVFYHSDFYGEHGFWEQTKPLQFNNETQLGCKCYLEYSEYNYLFKDGKWYVKNCWSDEDTDWKAVEEVIEK
jgi:hypothetical protein